MPYAFTEQGVAMLAAILNSQKVIMGYCDELTQVERDFLDTIRKTYVLLEGNAAGKKKKT